MYVRGRDVCKGKGVLFSLYSLLSEVLFLLSTNKSAANLVFLFLGSSCLCIDWHAGDSCLWELIANAVIRDINNSAAPGLNYLNNFLVMFLLFLSAEHWGGLKRDFLLFLNRRNSIMQQGFGPYLPEADRKRNT